jgi:hypothetical protein
MMNSAEFRFRRIEGCFAIFAELHGLLACKYNLDASSGLIRARGVARHVHGSVGYAGSAWARRTMRQAIVEAPQ